MRFEHKTLTGETRYGQTNLITGSTNLFQNLKGRSVGKKRKIKKNPQFFVLALIINKSFLSV